MKATGSVMTALQTATLVAFLSFTWGSVTSAQDTKVKVSAPGAEVQVDASGVKEAQKKQAEVNLKKSDQYADDTAKAVNRIPGANVKAEDLKETTVKKKAGVNLNPFSWLFRPITRLQEQSLRLEQQMMKLTGPIAALQPGMLRLEKQIVNVESRTEKVQNQMAEMQTDISAMRQELTQIKKPIMELKEPIVALRDPLKRIEKPITGVNEDLNELKALLSLVLTSIYIAAAVIAFGTPVAAILIWRNKSKLLKPAKDGEYDEDEAVSVRPKVVNKEFRKSA